LTTRDEVIRALRSSGVVAVIRIEDPGDVAATARALVSKAPMAARDYDRITENAEELSRIVREARGVS
jgi:2-keto-3-deoxy-6-phosphogluconate aldolase